MSVHRPAKQSFTRPIASWLLRAMVAASLAILALPHYSQANPVDVQAEYQQGLEKESVEHDLPGAIAIYQNLLESKEAGDELLGQVRLRMAGCYERLGQAQEAQDLYEAILLEGSGASAALKRDARANIERLKSKALPPSPVVKEVPVVVPLKRQFEPSRFSALFGYGQTVTRGEPYGRPSIAFRYQLSPASRSPVYLELGSLLPVGGPSFARDSVSFNSSQSIDAALKLKYQAHAALLAEIPHGIQRVVVPEVAAGAAISSTQIDYVVRNKSTGYPAEEPQTIKKTIVSPYLMTGLHFFPEHIISLLVTAAYVPSPYPTSVEVLNSSQNVSLSYPSRSLVLAASAFFKIGYWDYVPEVGAK